MSYYTEEGVAFVVHVYPDHVVKHPKQISEDELQEMADLQTEISARVKEVLPCKKVGNTLIMQRAKGVRCDTLDKDEWAKLKKRIKEIRKQARLLGYDLSGAKGPKNVFYDATEDRLYIVDGHGFRCRL